jgi:hypothetical protein
VGMRAGRIVYSRPHLACSSCPNIHTTMRSASGAWRVAWSAAWSVGRDLATGEDSVAVAAEWCVEILLSMITPSNRSGVMRLYLTLSITTVEYTLYRL